MPVAAFHVPSTCSTTTPNFFLRPGPHRPRRQRARLGVFVPRINSCLLESSGGVGDEGDADASEKAVPTPTLEEVFDAVDDMVMGRLPGEGREKVKVFGAWLDADVAGRKAGQGNRAAGLVARSERGETLTDKEKAEVIYEDAILVMKNGDCDGSFALLEKGVSLAGEDSRRGGEFKLWAVQALQGVGRDKKAVELLKSLKAHRDLDVRKVSAELLYIAQAPRLELNENDFVNFPAMSDLSEPFKKGQWKDFGKPRVVPWKNPKKKDEGFYVGSDTGQVTGNDPVMLVLLISTTLTLSYLLLG